MKKLRIIVSGKVYDVEVQVLEDDEAGVHSANLPHQGSTVAPTAPAVRPSPAPNAPPAPAMPPVSGGAGDANVIASPIAGTVQKVFVTAGMAIEAKTPVVLLDAMKMDTYIYAPRTGTVAEVCVETGSAVQVRDPLIRYAPEG